MINMLTAEQIKNRLEEAFAPHAAKAKIHDYNAKISFKVWSAKDGAHLFTVPNLPLRKLQSDQLLTDIINGTRREIEDKLKRS